MKKSYILLLIAISIANATGEKFSFQFNPLLPLLTIVCNTDIDVDIMPDKESKDSTRTNRPFCLLAAIQFQYAISKKFALFISPSFEKEFGGHVVTELMSNKTTYYGNDGLDLIIGLLYHPYETGLRGMYLGTFLVIGCGYITKDDKIIEDFLNIGYMAEIGYGWIKKNGFTITLGTGICKIYQIPSSPLYENLYGVNLGDLPFDVRLRLSIGYSF